MTELSDDSTVDAIHNAIAAHPPDEPQPKGDLLLSEWVLMSNWVDEEGISWTVRLNSHSLSRTHRLGMLHEGLFGRETGEFD